MNLIYVYKAVGAALLIFSGVYISLGYARAVSREIDAAKDAERLIRYIGECIAYRGDNIADIIGSYVSSCEASRAVWQRAGETSLSEALRGDSLPFDPETHRIISEFSASVGRGYREPQIELCRSTAAKLASRIGELEASKKDRLRVGSAICVFIFLSLVIMLI